MNDWTAYVTGSIVGAFLAAGVVCLYANGLIAWPWLLATSPTVIAGGLVGVMTVRRFTASSRRW